MQSASLGRVRRASWSAKPTSPWPNSIGLSLAVEALACRRRVGGDLITSRAAWRRSLRHDAPNRGSSCPRTPGRARGKNGERFDLQRGFAGERFVADLPGQREHLRQVRERRGPRAVFDVALGEIAQRVGRVGRANRSRDRRARDRMSEPCSRAARARRRRRNRARCGWRRP